MQVLTDPVRVKKIYAQAFEKTFSSIPLGLSLKIRYSKVQNTTFYPFISRYLIIVTPGRNRMKNSLTQKIFLAFLLAQAYYFYASIPTSTYTYVIKADIDKADPVHIKCTYKGCVLDLSNGIEFLSETGHVSSFPIVVTAEHPKVSSGTVQHLERIPDADCLWFDVSWSKEGTKTVWTIEQRAENDMPLRIPDNAIIVCYPPEFIDTLRDTTSQESSTIIHLPTIVLKKNLTQEEKRKRDDGLTRCVLAQLDVNACLSQTPSKLIQKGNSIKRARL